MPLLPPRRKADVPHEIAHLPVMLGLALSLVLAGAAVAWLVLYYRRPMATMPAPAMPRVERRDPTAPGATPYPDVARDMLLVIPDITGYTDFLYQSRFALRHAQFAVSELLNAMARAVDGRLRLCMPEGDALLLYAPLEGEADEAGLAAAVSDLVAAFYGRRGELASDNGCPCTVCRSIGELDLKVIVHRGDVLESTVAGHHMLSGMSVVMAHRLLKNDIGLRHYVLVTDAARMVSDRLAGSGEARIVTPQDAAESIAGRVHQMVAAQAGGDTADRAGAGLGRRISDACCKLRCNLRDLPGVGG
jgi:hypothetical protein